jgi:superfamily II DNA or RNA helicase
MADLRLLPEQRRVVDHLLIPSTNGVLVLHGTGTGKTRIAAAAVASLFRNQLIGAAYVITKKSVKAQTREVINKHCRAAQVTSYYLVVGTHSEIIRKIASRKQGQYNNHKDEYALVVDEAHGYFHPDAERTKQVVEVSTPAKKVLLMTATPMSTHQDDLMSMLRLIPRDATDQERPSNDSMQQEVTRLRAVLRTERGDGLRVDGPEMAESCNRDTSWFSLPDSTSDATGDGQRDWSHLTAQQKRHMKAIAPVPGAYRQVFVCPSDSRLAWQGVDRMNRTQRRYRDRFRGSQMRQRDSRALLALTADVMRRMKSQLRSDVSELGVAVSLLLQCNFRLMHDKSDNYGLSTILVDHVEAMGSYIRFPGKWGSTQACNVPYDLRGKVSVITKDARASGRPSLFSANVNAKTILRYFRKIAHGAGAEGPELSPKDVRTYAANVAFVGALKKYAGLTALRPAERVDQILLASESAATAIGTTSRVTKMHYLCLEIVQCAFHAPKAFDFHVRSVADPDRAMTSVAQAVLTGELSQILVRLPFVFRRDNVKFIESMQVQAEARGRVSVHYASEGPSTAKTTTQVVHIGLPPPDAKKYNRLVNEKTPGNFMHRLRQITSHTQSKIDWVLHHVSQWKQQNELPVLVYCDRVDAVKKCVVALSKEGIEAEALTGVDSEVDRRRKQARINTGSELEVLVLSDAGAEGIDFKGIRHIVFLSLPWTFAHFDQIRGRGARLHAHSHLEAASRTVTIWPLLAQLPRKKKTVDHSMWDSIQKRNTERSQLIAELLKVSLKNADIDQTQQRPPLPRSPAPSSPDVAWNPAILQKWGEPIRGSGASVKCEHTYCVKVLPDNADSAAEIQIYQMFADADLAPPLVSVGKMPGGGGSYLTMQKAMTPAAYFKQTPRTKQTVMRAGIALLQLFERYSKAVSAPTHPLYGCAHLDAQIFNIGFVDHRAVFYDFGMSYAPPDSRGTIDDRSDQTQALVAFDALLFCMSLSEAAIKEQEGFPSHVSDIKATIEFFGPSRWLLVGNLLKWHMPPAKKRVLLHPFGESGATKRYLTGADRGHLKSAETHLKELNISANRAATQLEKWKSLPKATKKREVTKTSDTTRPRTRVSTTRSMRARIPPQYVYKNRR